VLSKTQIAIGEVYAGERAGAVFYPRQCHWPKRQKSSEHPSRGKILSLDKVQRFF
jgi:hypothetical protein